MDPRWKHPFPALVAGPTCCGKSQFVKRLLESGEGIIEGTPENIIWCYGIYQPAYDKMQRNIPNITFVEGVPSDLESMISPSIRNLVVINDLMHELSNDQRITSLFTKGCHHRNLRVIFIVQNIFHRRKELRDMSLNCHYLVVFKSPRDSSQVKHLPKQMFPSHVKCIQEAFQNTRKRSYGYLLCDLKPETPIDFRLCNNIFPGEAKCAYVRKVQNGVNDREINQLSMAQRLRKNQDFLKLLVKCTPNQRKAILKVADDALVKTICECILNVLKETVPVSKPAKRKLLAYKKSLIALAEKSTPIKRRKKILVQQEGNFLRGNSTINQTF